MPAECFNPLTAGKDGCTLAINQALASVGVYWAGGPLGVENPANPCERLGPYFPYASPNGHLWWRDRVLVFVADRSSFIRPSFNPITTRDEPGTRPATNDGVPRWDGSSYVFPTAADPRDGNGPTYDAYLETVQDFVGYIANGNGPNNTPEVFRSKLLPDGTFIDGLARLLLGKSDRQRPLPLLQLAVLRDRHHRELDSDATQGSG